MTPGIEIEVELCSLFKALSGKDRFSVKLEKEDPRLIDLLVRLSSLSDERLDPLLFESDRKRIMPGLMVKVNDEIFTGLRLGSGDLLLRAGDKVSLMYIISGG